MTAKRENVISNKVENTTNTEIEALKSIERAFYDKNPQSKKRNTEKSLKWFSTYIPRAYNKIRTSQVMRDSKLYEDQIRPGQMYFFVYDALHKQTLPAWDAFPLIFPWDSWSKNGVRYFLGINLHYLKPEHRLIAMRALLKLRNQKRYNESTKLKISWKILKSLSESKFFKHSIKMYRADHVRSKFIRIPPQSWEMSAFLPIARWQKGSSQEAWKI